VRSFHQDLVEEIKVYEAIKRGDLRAVARLGTLGQQMIGLRIAKGLSQRELAARLGVHETQVSRDERNEYHGLTLDRATRIMEALGVRLVSSYVPASA
jgi:DNA-binding XRE family transcriptional regulator